MSIGMGIAIGLGMISAAVALAWWLLRRGAAYDARMALEAEDNQ